MTTVTIGYAGATRTIGGQTHILTSTKSLCGLGHVATVRNLTFRDVDCRRCRKAQTSRLLTLKVDG